MIFYEEPPLDWLWSPFLTADYGDLYLFSSNDFSQIKKNIKKVKKNRVVFDPVGVNYSQLRTPNYLKLFNLK